MVLEASVVFGASGAPLRRRCATLGQSCRRLRDLPEIPGMLPQTLAQDLFAIPSSRPRRVSDQAYVLAVAHVVPQITEQAIAGAVAASQLLGQRMPLAGRRGAHGQMHL